MSFKIDFNFSNRFSPEKEKYFQDFARGKSIHFLRVGLIIGFFLYCFFVILDRSIMPVSWQKEWEIRFLGIAPIFIVLYGITYCKIFNKIYTSLMIFAYIIASFEIIIMLAIAKTTEPGYSSYFSGLLLCIIWFYSFFRIRLLFANLTTVLIIIAYFFVEIYYQNIHVSSPYLLINNLFFLLGTFLLSLMSAFIIDYYTRREFLHLEKISFVNSHQLRAPLVRMLGILDAIKNDVNNKKIIEFQVWLDILSESGNEVDIAITKISQITDTESMLQISKLKPKEQKNYHVEEIFLIDDDPVVNMLNKKIIQKLYPKIKIRVFCEAISALLILDKCSSKDQILILLDINMPEVDGFEFLERYEGEKNIFPIVMLTSSVDEKDKLKSFQFKNVIGHIQKPFNKEKLISIMNSNGDIN